MSLPRPLSVLSHASRQLPRRTFLRGLGAALLLAGAGPLHAQTAAERLIVSGASGQLGALVVDELLARGEFWIIKSDDIEPRLMEFRNDYDGYKKRTAPFKIYK